MNHNRLFSIVMIALVFLMMTGCSGTSTQENTKMPGKVDKSTETSTDTASRTSVTSKTTLQYQGYSLSARKKHAIVNGEVYQVGDFLDYKDGCILKSIHPTHIVVRSKADNSEFAVQMEN